jgi:hypothetical protein
LKQSDVKELHYITPIANVPSIVERGILSHTLSKKLPHASLAMEEIQSRRRNKQIPGARKLHDYANLYFDAHNPMLSKRRDRNNQICVLSVDPSVLDLPNVIISDQNASSNYVRFYPVKAGLEALNKNIIYASFWLHPDNRLEEWAHKSAKCAEVLMPDRIESKYILSAYVANETALRTFQELNIQLTVSIRSDIFF